jgi:chemotaxis protein histidine kinase CheA
MFKFLRFHRKKGKAIEPAPELPDFTASQLVQRFHSESALCDPSHRRILIEAAETTQAQIQLRKEASNARQMAVDRCHALAELQSSVVSVRQSQDEIRCRAKMVEDHIGAHDAPRTFLEGKTSEFEQKIDSLRAMTGMVEQATVCLEEDMRKTAQRRARSRSKSTSRARESMEYKWGVRGSVEYQTAASSYTDLGPVRASFEAEGSLTDLIKEAHDHLDEVPRRWEKVDTEALHREIAEVKLLLQQYEASTMRRQFRLANIAVA